MSTRKAPTKKKAQKKAPKRELTAKQKKFFGSKAERGLTGKGSGQKRAR